MTVHSDPHRYREDAHVIVARTLDDFSMLRDAFARAHGVIMPFAPLGPREKADIVAYARTKGADGKAHKEDLPAHVTSLSIVGDAMKDAFARATGQEVQRIRFIVNNTRPRDFHRHPATMTYALTGVGTLVQPRLGLRYIVPAEHLFMMEENLLHKCPDYTPSAADPRIMLMAY